MPKFAVPVKVVTVGSLPIWAESAARAKELAESVDVIDAEFLYETIDVQQLDASVSTFHVEGEPLEVPEDEA